MKIFAKSYVLLGRFCKANDSRNVSENIEVTEIARFYTPIKCFTHLTY